MSDREKTLKEIDSFPSVNAWIAASNTSEAVNNDAITNTEAQQIIKDAIKGETK